MSTATDPSTITITDTRFAALKTKLRELFELDKSDLDFGIYRIMAAKNAEVTAFLDRQLKDVVRDTLAEHGAGATDQVQAELDAAIEQARNLGADPETLPRVRELRAQLESAGGASAADLEADIYNHLLNFFSRYYDEGDFISKRRYKGDTYAIPYSGEEVVLHWANKDQYYIKSGEWHKDYRFRLPGDKTVRFKLVEATQEAGNNKEADDAKRRYILDAEQPIEYTANELTLRFQFRVPTDDERQTVKDNETTRIFGGNYDRNSGRTQGDEREQFCADAETRCLAGIDASPEAAPWRPRVTAESPTDARPNRTILGKHLDDFTARNTFDYFIHKDLGGFLRRELDFYIKNEVVRLDDLDSLPADHLQTVQGRVKAIRRVAGRIIQFLAAIEDFQKKMWLKKKFVLETNWLVTIDRIPDRLRDIVADNDSQWAEWEALGFIPDEREEDEGLFGNAQWGTRAYLDACDKLVVDTRLYDDQFRNELLASETILGGHQSLLFESQTGTLLSAENSQGLRCLIPTLHSAVDCIYADPPYNTSASEIIYKNSFKHSSWLALMWERICEAYRLLRDTGVFCITIDDFEMHRLRALTESILGEDHVLGIAAIKNNPSGRATAKGFSIAHEYAMFLGRGEEAQIGRLRHTEEQVNRYKEVDDLGRFEWVNFRKHGGANANRYARPKLFYYFFVSEEGFRIPEQVWNSARGIWELLEQPTEGEIVLLPLAGNGDEKTWKWGIETASANLVELRVGRDQSGQLAVYRKARLNDAGTLPRTLWDKKEYSSTEYGTNLLASIFGKKEMFAFAKSVYAVRDCILVATQKKQAVILDHFAGSGTTGHAVLMLNREDQGIRRFVLIEMGRYFGSALKPRITKVIYSPDWRNGKAQSHDKGVSALVKYFALESYEDALNNLPTPQGELLTNVDESVSEAMITYSLDLELGPHLLNLDAFRDPWHYAINAQLAGEDEIRAHKVDLVETFNYLLGLKVKAYGPIERYKADFDRREHADDLGGLVVRGRLQRDPEGPYVYQRVEGELNDGNDTRVLVIWRRLTDDPEKDAAVLEAWMQRHREVTTERTEHREYHLIYINGPVTLPQPTQELRTVLPIEQTFKDRMFEDTDGASS